MTKDFEEWARHYDILFWTYTTLMTTVIGGLLIYNVRNFNLWLSILGMFVTIVSVYFAASFRELRHLATGKFDNELQQLFKKRRLAHQWYWYCCLFVVIEVFWTILILKRTCFETIGSYLQGISKIDPLKVYVVFIVLICLAGIFGIGFTLYWSNQLKEIDTEKCDEKKEGSKTTT